MSINKAARKLRISPSTAKLIVKQYRKFFKIFQKQIPKRARGPPKQAKAI